MRGHGSPCRAQNPARLRRATGRTGTSRSCAKRLTKRGLGALALSRRHTMEASCWMGVHDIHAGLRPAICIRRDMEDELLLRVRAGGSQDAVAEARDAIKRHFEEREAERRRDVILHRPACHAQSGPAALLSARRGRWPSQPGLGSASRGRLWALAWTAGSVQQGPMIGPKRSSDLPGASQTWRSPSDRTTASCGEEEEGANRIR